MPKQDQSMQYRLALFAQAKELGIKNLRPTMPNHKIEQLISQAKHEVELATLRKECKKEQIKFKDSDTIVDLKKKLAKATSLEMKRQQSKQEEKAKKVLIAQAKEIGLKLSETLTLKEMLFEIEVRSTFLKEQTVKQPLIVEAASLGVDLDVVLSVSEMKKTIKAKQRELRAIETQEQRELRAIELQAQKEKMAIEALEARVIEEEARKKAEAKAKRSEAARAKQEAAQKLEAARRAKLEAKQQVKETRKSLIAIMKQEGLTFNVANLSNEQIEEKINATLEKRRIAAQKAQEKKDALARAKQERAAKLAAQKAAEKAEKEWQEELARREAIRAEKEAAKIEAQKIKAKLAKEKADAKAKAKAQKEKERAQAQKLAEQRALKEKEELAIRMAEQAKDEKARQRAKAIADKKEQERQEKIAIARAKEEAARLAAEKEGQYRLAKYETLVSTFNMSELNDIAFEMQKDLANVQDEINEMIDRVQTVKPEGQIFDFTSTPDTYDFYETFVNEESVWAAKEEKLASSILVASDKLGKTSEANIDLLAKEIKKEIAKLERQTRKSLNGKINSMNNYLVAAHEYVAYLNDVYTKDVAKEEKARQVAAEKQRYANAFAKVIAKAIDPEFKAPSKGISIEELSEIVTKSNADYRAAIEALKPTKEQLKLGKKLGIEDYKLMTNTMLASMIKTAQAAIAKEEARLARAKAKEEAKFAEQRAKEQAEQEMLDKAKTKAEAKAQLAAQKEDSKIEAEKQVAQIEVKQEITLDKNETKESNKNTFDAASEIQYAKSIGASVRSNASEKTIKATIEKQEEVIRVALQKAIQDEKDAKAALNNEVATHAQILKDKEVTLVTLNAEKEKAIKEANAKYNGIVAVENNKLSTLTKQEEAKYNKLMKKVKTANGGIKKYQYADLVKAETIEAANILEDTTIPAVVNVVKTQVVEAVEEKAEQVVKVAMEKTDGLPKILTVKFDTKAPLKRTNKSNKWRLAK